LGTSDDNGYDGEISASLKFVNKHMNNSGYCRIKECMFFQKKFEMSNFLKIHTWESSCSMGADRQTIERTGEHDEAYNRFSQCSECVKI
jgi:hypothetical protein